MKILLINPPLCNFRPSSAHAVPLGLLYLAAVIEKAGHEAKVLDADNLRLTWDELKQKLSEETPDIVGITATTLSMMALSETAKVAYQVLPKAKIIAGGFGPSLEPEKTLHENPEIDLICLGESEETIVDLLKSWQNNTPLSRVSGVIFRDGDKIVKTAPRQPPMDLDSIPFPAYHLLEPSFEKFKGIHLNYEGMRRPIIVMFASRGCPHRCIFCSLGSRLVRFRSPKNIVDEIEKYVKKFKVGSVQLYDDEFIGMSPAENQWVSEICDEIIKRGLNNIGYLVQGRCSKFIELATLKKMKQAGFCWIWWGVESGSQGILDSIKKDITAESVKRTFTLARQANLKSMMFIMVGFPEEREEDIKKTADLIAKVKPDSVRIHIATPLPGSEMWQILKQENMIDDYNFLNYDMRSHAVHHTKYFSGQEIIKNYEMLKFRFEQGHKKFVKIILNSFMSLHGLKSLPRRTKKALNYGMRWLKWATH